MDTTDAIRYLGIQVLNSMQHNLDEDVYNLTKKTIENSSRKKLIKKFLLFLNPIANLHEKGELNVETFKELDYFKEDAEISENDLNQMVNQVMIAKGMCEAIRDIPEETLTMLETMAGSLTKEFEKNIPDEQKNKLKECGSQVNPMDIITKTLSKMENSTDANDVFNEAKNQLKEIGMDEATFQSIESIVPNILNSLQPQQSDKRDLLKKFDMIGAEVKKNK
tara:strand:+ start:97 stop:762 length:666 start_codon:yes stop_codon:yes gene_type:complete